MLPVGITELRKKLPNLGRIASLAQGAHPWPFRHHSPERGEPPLRMIRRPLPAALPKFRREDQASEFGPTWPPFFPKRAEVCAGRSFKRRQVRGREKTADTKEQRGNIGLRREQRAQRQTLGKHGERKFVALVSEGGGDGLVKRFVRSVDRKST